MLSLNNFVYDFGCGCSPVFWAGYAALGFRYSDLEFVIKKTCFA